MTARTICVRLTGPQMRVLRIAVDRAELELEDDPYDGAARDRETLNRAWQKLDAAWANQARR